MRKKNLFLVVLAMVLVCAISVTGTLAYLTKDTGAVTNTFIAAGGGEIAESLTLEESEATDTDGDGIYTLDTAKKVTANSYNVVPGVPLTKDPLITITKKTDAPAYLYVEVVDKDILNAAGLDFEMADHWMELKDSEGTAVTGKNGGAVWVYCGDATTAQVIAAADNQTEDLTYQVIKDDTVTVEDNKDKVTTLTDSGKELKFYAYLAQTTVKETVKVDGVDKEQATSNAATVYTTCFPYVAPTP